MGQEKILNLIFNKLENIEKEQQEMKKQQIEMKMCQDEMYIIQRGIEESIKVTRAEQEKMQFTLVDIQGKVTTLASKVKEHDEVINQIRAIE